MSRLEERAQRPVGGELRRPRRVEGARVALEVRLGHLVRVGIRGMVRIRVRVRVRFRVSVGPGLGYGEGWGWGWGWG